MIDGSVLQSVQKCFEKKRRVAVKMVVMSVAYSESFSPLRHGLNFVHNESLKFRFAKTSLEKTKPRVL